MNSYEDQVDALNDLRQEMYSNVKCVYKHLASFFKSVL